ncbi:MAG: vWA domain-containing protein [Fusobacteriota bacterium]
MFEFANIYFLLLIPIALFIFLRKRKTNNIKFSRISLFKDQNIKKTIKHKIGPYIILLAVILFIIALARPRISTKNQIIERDGLDIIISMDISRSMEAQDFKPNRLEAAKKVGIDFVEKRESDRIGFVVFSGTAYTKIPLTLDHLVLKETISRVNFNDVSKRGTAIGMGISVALNRLKDSKSKSKVIILLTDGENNTGEINPITAMNLAKELDVKIYTIGVGAETITQNTFFGKREVKNTALDEELLEKISRETKGKYFRAKDLKSLEEIFNNIDKLEKTKIEDKSFYNYNELYYVLVKIGLLLLIIGLFFEKILFLKIP